MVRHELNLTPVSTHTAREPHIDVPELDDSPTSPLFSPDSPAIPQTGWSTATWPAAQLFKQPPNDTLSIDAGLHLTNEVLGKGTFCQVVKARGLHGVYAVKLLRKGQAGDLDAEAKTLECLNEPGHPNVIKLLGRWNGGLVFPLYEATLGSAMAELATEWNRKQESYDFSFADMNQPLCGRKRFRDWARQLASALAYVHSKQLVHGDLKPNNVCYNRKEDLLVLTDFSKLVDDDAAFSLTYASPELRAGSPTSAASDMYALGVVLLYCATGLEPYSEAKNTQQRLLWSNKVKPQDSYSPEHSSQFVQELPLLNPLLGPSPPSATHFLSLI